MPRDVEVDPYHDPDHTDWIWHQEGLYPVHIPAPHYLGRAVNGCQWDGPGFSYELRPGADCVSRIMKVADQVAMRTAGNRRPRIRTALYRLHDSGGRLLYVGITDTPQRRFTEHAKDKHWWPEVAGSAVQWFENRRLALAVEGHAIRTEKPLYNVVHNSPAPG